MQSCLYTTVVNTAASERAFSFLGHHGKRLASGEQFSQPGNIVDKLAGNTREFAALERALENGDLAIMRTPAVHVFDSADSVTKLLGIDNGTLDVTDPCWGAYESVSE